MTYDNNAYTITSTYHPSGLLTMYTTHPTPPTNPKRDYDLRMTQINSFAMTGNPDTFRQGASALRNVRDWAKEKREELIIAANGQVPDAEQSDLVSSTDSSMSVMERSPNQPESETSADELALGIDPFASSSHRTPIGAQPKPPPKAPSSRRSNKISQVNKRSSRRPRMEKAEKEIHMEPEDILSI